MSISFFITFRTNFPKIYIIFSTQIMVFILKKLLEFFRIINYNSAYFRRLSFILGLKLFYAHHVDNAFSTMQPWQQGSAGGRLQSSYAVCGLC